jgi:D-alanyl-lipoteichoic acid acyltransferase DltB (MBOAT superfamily)
MGRIKEKKKRKPFLAISLIGNLGMLFFFKYFNFFSLNINDGLGMLGVDYTPAFYSIILPLGISFYTFQTMSYSIDLYNGNIKPETHFGYFALYVSFFPQLIAGPIERSSHLIPQLKKNVTPKMEDIRYGLNKIALGFFKKLVVADSVSVFVDFVFVDLSVSNGAQVSMALFFFAIQSFADFSGYTDIAMGSARLMGIKLIDNFNRPYWVRNFRDFWSRWHMSLTQWIFIYLQTPLLGKRRSQFRAFWVNILVLGTIGFWHGATWPFILFGVSHGLVMGVQLYIEYDPRFPVVKNQLYQRLFRPLWNATLMCLLVLMYRSQNVDDIIVGYTKIFTDFSFSFSDILSGFNSSTAFYSMAGATMLLIPTIFFNRELKFKSNLLYLIVVFGLIMLIGQDARQQFLYFQF